MKEKKVKAPIVNIRNVRLTVRQHHTNIILITAKSDDQNYILKLCNVGGLDKLLEMYKLSEYYMILCKTSSSVSKTFREKKSLIPIVSLIVHNTHWNKK